MEYPNIHFNDGNDKLDMNVSGMYGYDPQFRADLIAFIKARAAQIPGVGTISAYETVIEGTSV